MRRSSFAGAAFAIASLWLLAGCGRQSASLTPRAFDDAHAGASAASYTLVFRLGDGANTIVKDGEQVAISMETPAGSAKPVAWTVFKPRSTTVVTWSERDYQVYAALPGDPKPGSSITMQARSQRAHRGWTYTLTPFFDFEAKPGDGDAFSVHNADRRWEHSGVGLAQTATIDGRTGMLVPESFVSVPYGESTHLLGKSTVLIFLTRHGSGAILDTIPERALTVELTPAKPSADIEFRPETKTFFVTK